MRSEAFWRPTTSGRTPSCIDDAQPENVDQAVLVARPDIRVVKCLARIPGLSCPFDMRLFTRKNRDEEVTFTCLAETGRRATLPVVRHRR